eukprot:TRINITY_DN8688_c0_g1_i5.p1 TRINITY_DN8688_c0_g1~~TRINITY_DN8688_c0_g1_i5.p1  ORF type:complete len:223 (+),score=21.54 TRINITY_DN8688_c0_g1_i5:201-869(+)
MYKGKHPKRMFRDNINCTDHNILGIKEWNDIEQVNELWSKAKSSMIQSTKNLNAQSRMRDKYMISGIENLMQSPVEPNDRYRDDKQFLRSASSLLHRGKCSKNTNSDSKSFLESLETESKRSNCSRYSHVCLRCKDSENESSMRHAKPPLLSSSASSKKLKRPRMAKTPVLTSRKNSDAFNFGFDYRKLREAQREQIRELMRKTVIKQLSQLKDKPDFESSL